MLNDEKEPHIRRAVFLPMYYTVISLMVIKCFIRRLNLYNPTYFQIPLSLWAAWGIYSQPIRYRSLFPHNEARKQAIAGAGMINDVQCNEQCNVHFIQIYKFQFVSSRSYSSSPSSRSGLTPRCCCCWGDSMPSSLCP